jgi:CDP-glycerol glycerophosphotransferase
MAEAAQLCPPAKRMAVRLREAYQKRQYQKKYASQYETDAKLVLFCAYSGRQYACSPKALYEQMCREERYKDYHFVWAFCNPEEFSSLESGRTRLVRYGSDDFQKVLAQAAYWITNTRIPGFAVKKPDQVYVQTWHGTPLKRLGFDVEHYITGADDKKSMQRSYLTDAVRYDYLLSPSPYYSEKMRSAFHLDEIHKSDCVLELGYPRNDSLYTSTDADRERIRQQLGVSDQKVILYAPTWREEGLRPQEGYTYGNGLKLLLGLDLSRLQEQLGEEYVILLRCHYYISALAAKQCAKGQIVDVSSYPEINELYLAADLLLTDYSSVFFDYAVTKKPMLFYMYDLPHYREVRDFYFDTDRLPGEIITKEEKLVDAIRQSITVPPDLEKYDRFLADFQPHPGACAKEVLKRVIRETDIKS